jgi:GNAT superfamily N-acetyltransferase
MDDEAALQLFNEQVRVTFAVEPFIGDDWDRFAEMQHAHFEEVAGFKDMLVHVNPDIDKYLANEKNGRLHVIKARAHNKTLVGYSIHIVYTHLHYRHVLIASDDVFYVTPTMRGRGVAKAMRSYALNTLRDRGVNWVTAREKPGIPHTHLKKLGFEVMETVYARVL